MSLEIKGIEELQAKLEALGKVGDKVEGTAVKKGAKVVLDHFKKNAPKDSGNSRNALKVTSTKRFKNGGLWSQVGIDGSNWDKTKGLYFQHYGYLNHATGKRVNKNVGWMSEEFAKVEKYASETIINEVQKELNKIL
ncbi:HK97-gp10 family putative phage morphogenesis protein [Romboutsia timonensis]|uniref:HK97-gp10 family putative phage morphogenesis protein n=1 Tax=Romboutsia timonensis TaxID=1776391 RepID=UPI002A7FD8C6|nr:HK97-gp10 family putative phage morphogenesis protein [Romboutsia timonensis]MDY3960171.1 HK97-gp10 family putative phage morphogenesis protein [Romboutsia timonensis]